MKEPMTIPREVNRPIFLVGIGRSGSTLVHNVLSYHDQVAWLTRAANSFPTRPNINRTLLQILDLPVIGSALRRRISPSEHYAFWDHLYPAFSNPCRDLTADDVTPAVRARIRRAFSYCLTSKRLRLLVKVTGWPRVGFLLSTCPDSQFVHIIRDGRAVAYSQAHFSDWQGWRGPPNWRRGELSDEDLDTWNRFNRSFLALAAIEWNLLMARMEEASEGLSHHQFLEVRYEEICSEPLGSFQEITAYSRLPWSSRIEKKIATTEVKSANTKWQSDLTTCQRQMLDEIMGPRLEKYGYV